MYTYLSVHGIKIYINTCTHLYVYINTHKIISIHELYVYACIYLLILIPFVNALEIVV